jgi:hypothetical protein
MTEGNIVGAGSAGAPTPTGSRPHSFAETRAPSEGRLSYSCFVCALTMEGPYDAVMRLLSIHSAEHSDGVEEAHDA